MRFDAHDPRTRPRRLSGALAASLALVLGLALVAPAPAAAQLTRTAEEVECDAIRLQGLFQRAALEGGERPLTLFAATTAPEVFSLLLVENQWNALYQSEPEPLERERHLAAMLSTEVRSLLLNPERPELFQVALARIDSATTLSLDATPALVLRLRPATTGDPVGDLVINNLAEPPAGAPFNGTNAGGARPGRALEAEGVVGFCDGSQISERDQETLEILTRLIRVRIPNPPPFDVTDGDAWVALYRGGEEDTYRIDVYGEDGAVLVGPRSFVLEVTRDGTGALVDGLLTAVDPLVPTVASWVGDLFFRPPIFPPTEVWEYEDPEVVRVDFSTGFVGSIALDLDGLLDETAWNP